MITVNAILTKTRNPTEYDFRLENEIGEIVHQLDDGYTLVKFNGLLIKRMVRVEGRKMWKLVNLEWYVHENDFFIKPK